MKKDYFWVKDKTEKARYNFWANAASKEVVWMSVNFQFEGIDRILATEFEKYCTEKQLLVTRLSSEQDYKGYKHKDINLHITLLPEHGVTKIVFTRKYAGRALTLEDFVYFKDSVAPFLGLIAKKPDTLPLIASFQNQDYKELVGLLSRINPKERLVDEMAFLLRSKDDPKKLRFAVESIRKYAKMLSYNPEGFLKKELGKNYYV